MFNLKEASRVISQLKDPFSKDCIIRVSTWASRDSWDNTWTYSGTVEFENGNTKGEQEFEGVSMADVIQKMEIFVEGL